VARLTWSEPGNRLFEAGVDRAVLYVEGGAGVAWTGLISVQDNRSGGQSKPRFLDGVKVSNHASLEQFEGTIEAFAYPDEFGVCDGTVKLQNGLRARRQRRRPFSMVYRSKVGNDLKGIDHAYKIHILYNLRAEPADRGYETLGEDIEPITFSWDVTARPEMVDGLVPTAYFEIDSRDVPQELLETVENILYGDSTQDASLPSAGELFFLFDSYDDLVYDAGNPFTPVFSIHDAGSASTSVTSTIDSGGV
jgi:hypothetical protein